MNYFLKISLLLLGGFGGIKASDINMFEIQKKYFTPQKAHEQYATCQEYAEFLKRQEHKQQKEREEQEKEQYRKSQEERKKQEEQEEKKKQEENKQKEEKEKCTKREEYKSYFAQQEVFYQGLVNLGIPGARPLDMDEVLAESVLSNQSEEIKEIISGIEQSVLFKNDKNMLFYGPSGTGKSALAQAIAIKCKVPCLFFNVGTISTEYKDSGIQNLNKIFEYAQELEKNLDKPCVIIFDELESLTKKHVGTNSSESNILIGFWQELDKLGNSKVIVIGTMNNAEDVPDQIINRTSMIKIPLPNLAQREAVLSYYLKRIQEQYKLEYPEWLTAAYLARRTIRFSNRDLENLVVRITKPMILAQTASAGSNKVIWDGSVSSSIKKIQWQFIEKWQRTFKKHLRDPKFVFGIATAMIFISLQKKGLAIQQSSYELQIKSYNIQIQNLENQIKGLDLQIRSLAIQEQGQLYQKEGLVLQREALTIQRDGLLSQKEGLELQKEAMSSDHIAKQAAMNSSILGIPVGMPFYYGYEKDYCKNGYQWICSKFGKHI